MSSSSSHTATPPFYFGETSWDELKSRMSALDEEEQDRRRGDPAIYRVDYLLRQKASSLFDGDLVCLGLFQTQRQIRAHSPCGITETFKSDLVIKFLADSGGGPQDWENIRKIVVRDPRGMKRLYDGHWHLDLEEENVRLILFIDAIVLTWILLSYWGPFLQEEYPSLSSLSKRFSRTNGVFWGLLLRIRVVLTMDIFKAENQIPLELVRNVIAIMLHVAIPNSAGISYDTEANEIRKNLCLRFVEVWRNSFPSFVTSPVGAPLVDVDNCQHLLHCFAQAFWNGADGKVCKDSDDTPPAMGQTMSVIVKFCTSFMQKLTKILHYICKCRRGNRDLQLPKSKKIVRNMLTASKLRRHGVDFQGQKEFYPKFQQHKFLPWKATLFLPTLKGVYDESEVGWRNFIAFEEQYKTRRNEKKPFYSYIEFMDLLINTGEDVAVLNTGKSPVIKHNSLGDDEAVAKLFNSMTQYHIGGSNITKEWSSVPEKLDDFVQAPFRTWWSAFFQSYSQTPWLPISIFAAALLLLLTVVQTLYTVVSFYSR